MGYEVSLRHSEADHIEVVSIEEAKHDQNSAKAEEEDRQRVIGSKVVDSNDSDEQALGDKMLVAERKRQCQQRPWLNRKQKDSTASSTWHWWRNPNCGKTSLFNFASGAHERVDNYGGVSGCENR